MPVIFFKDLEGKIRCEGLAGNHRIYFQRGLITLSKNSREAKESSANNTTLIVNRGKKPTNLIIGKGVEVNVGGFGIGKFLYSDSFGPCQAVVAKLADGNFAMYHASHYHADGIDCQAFIKELKARGIVGDVYVFKKTLKNSSQETQISYDVRGALLVLGLIGEGIPVKRLQVGQYLSIIADSNTNKICLSDEMLCRSEENDINELRKNEEKEQLMIVDLDADAISHEQSILEAMSTLNKYNKSNFDEDVYKAIVRYYELNPDKKSDFDLKKITYHKSYFNNNSIKYLKEVEESQSDAIMQAQEDISDKRVRYIVSLILDATEKLRDKTTFCCFPAHNAITKANAIEGALIRAIDALKNNSLEYNKPDDFLEYKVGDTLSIKEAMEMQRTPKATPHMYERIMAKIKEKQDNVRYIEVKPKK